ncbi:hypothetical protein NMY22_g10095 [Coprinellus aureogranulatus]|nr:hypothetical protein NMY22_g10095 [Coprinellus aureogranulatus]
MEPPTLPSASPTTTAAPPKLPSASLAYPQTTTAAPPRLPSAPFASLPTTTATPINPPFPSPSHTVATTTTPANPTSTLPHPETYEAPEQDAPATRRSARGPIKNTWLEKQNLIGTNVVSKPLGPTSKTNTANEDAGPPLWFNEALAHLQVEELGDAWMRTVQTWVGLEKALGYGTTAKTPLPVQHRPEEWGKWASKSKHGARPYDALPIINDPAEFGVTVIRWWYSVQPPFRASQNGFPCSTFKDPASDGDPWVSIRKSGPNGTRAFARDAFSGFWAGALPLIRERWHHFVRWQIGARCFHATHPRPPLPPRPLRVRQAIPSAWRSLDSVYLRRAIVAALPAHGYTPSFHPPTLTMCPRAHYGDLGSGPCHCTKPPSCASTPPSLHRRLNYASHSCHLHQCYFVSPVRIPFDALEEPQELIGTLVEGCRNGMGAGSASLVESRHGYGSPFYLFNIHTSPPPLHFQFVYGYGYRQGNEVPYDSTLHRSSGHAGTGPLHKVGGDDLLP